MIIATNLSTWWLQTSDNDTHAWSVEWFNGLEAPDGAGTYYVTEFGDYEMLDYHTSMPTNWDYMHTWTPK